MHLSSRLLLGFATFLSASFSFAGPPKDKLNENAVIGKECKKTSEETCDQKKALAEIVDYIKTDDQDKIAKYSIFDYGKDCFEKMDRTPVPQIDCSKGALLPVTVNGVPVTDHIPKECDSPGMVHPATSCVPGGRLVVVESGNIVTVAMCRRNNGPDQWPIDSPMTHNVAIIQHNKATRDTCWFQIRKHEKGLDGRSILTPYQEGRKQNSKEAQEAAQFYVHPSHLLGQDACVKCHDSPSLWIKTPLITQMKGSSNAQDRANALPSLGFSKTPVSNVGLAYADWNLKENQPRWIKINQEAYDEVVPLTTQEQELAKNKKLESAKFCTQCHVIGSSPLAKKGDMSGSCNHFVNDWSESSEKGPIHDFFIHKEDGLSTRYWMPPRADKTVHSDKEWHTRYGRALKAIKACCENPNLATPSGRKVCTE